MLMNKTLLLLAALALPLGPLAHAAVNPAIVSGDAKWLIHADFNALRESTLGKELISIVDANASLPIAGTKIGINAPKVLATIGSVTAYGANLSSDPAQIDGTLVVQGTPDLRKILEAVLIQANLANPEEVVEITDLPFPAYALREVRHQASEADKKPKELKDTDEVAKDKMDERKVKKARSSAPMEVVIAFPPEPIVVVSKSKPQILKACDVFRGKAPSLAKTPASPLNKFVAGSEGAYIFTASTVPAEKFFPDDAAQARVLKMTNAGSFALGERGENTFLHGQLVASSGVMADKLMKILQGMTAMLSLAETSDKQLADFLNSTTVNREGDVVTLDLAYSSARLVTMIKGLQQSANAPQNRGPRSAPMLNGRSLAEWTAESGPAREEGKPAPLTIRTIENVALKNGTLLTLARQNNGGKNVRFDHVEIIAAEGGAPLVFRSGYMQPAGPGADRGRGNWQTFQFPGADGTYTLKVAYVNDPDGKATFAVSARDMGAPDANAKK